MQKFGAFVNFIGDESGFKALLPISEISRSRVDNIEEVLSVGQELTVSVLNADWKNEKVSVSLKSLLENPWDNVSKNYPVDSKHDGKISRIADFGLFIELEEGIDGLVHISELDAKRVAKVEDVVQLGDEIIVTLPEPQPLDVQPENIPLDIIYEDEDVVVVNKARGMVVHPAAGNYSGTLVNALLYHCKNLSGINGVIRPGIVHRLDKDTSGIMICAKNDAAHVSLSEQIQSKTAQRTYLAVVRGNLKTDSGVIETQIARDKDDRKKMAVVKEGGRNAVTEYEVVERFGKYRRR